MTKTLRVAEAIQETKQIFSNTASEQEAHWLLMDVLKCSFADLVINKERVLTEYEIKQFREFAQLRKTGMPLAYVLGHQDFFKYRFFVNQNVLIPRPETELIVELASAHGPFKNIADLGTGSGCIGLSLLKEYEEARLWACDISEKALEVFSRNAESLKLADRVTTAFGSVTNFTFHEAFDLVVSNPPYIAELDSRLESDVLKYEPAQALFAPENGLAYYKQWSVWASHALQKGGMALFEIGIGQQNEVTEFFKTAGFEQVKIYKDLFGVERVVCATKG